MRRGAEIITILVVDVRRSRGESKSRLGIEAGQEWEINREELDVHKQREKLEAEKGGAA